ncbi:MAG TPA: cytochrome c biogenesis protein DipZ [Solirubrobacteraceae bacterium]|nr:cytochrome c biogenesis protein DipZ [Solirubrobacteraceae bacterium]
MALLLLFALVAGAGTALSPCVLPVLPALLSASATGGRRRPLGIVLGLAVTFTITIVGLAEVVDGVGLGDGSLRSLAVVVLLGFGVLLLVPPLTDRVEALLSPLIRLGPKTTGDGFLSGLLVGAALGFVYAPCAGPILAAVISVSAASGETVAVAVAYAVGSAAALLALSLVGRRLLDRFRGPALQRVMGVVMVVTALAIATDRDVAFQNTIADDLPAWVVNPTGDIERSDAVAKRLDDLRGPSRFAASGDGLPELGAAPEFAGVTRWLNAKPLSLASLRGRVVLIDFWTYTCINCLRTLPYLRAWDERYRDRGLTIVGVHTPEFEFEKDTANVEAAIARNHLRYAVAQDNDYGTWNAWGNQYWPAKYLIDAKGQVRYVHFGEGDYDKTEAAIRSLLPDPGRRVGHQPGEVPGDATPETYLGAARAQGWEPAVTPGTHDYPGISRLDADRFALGGRWKVDDESATAVSDATLRARVHGKSVYLVLGSSGRVEVTVDGRREKTVVVDGQRLYELMRRPRAGEHELLLRFDPGVAGYAFTFG